LTAWLLTLLRKRSRDGLQSRAPTPYAAVALQREADLVRKAPPGTRNDRLNRSAFSLGQLIAQGAIGRAEVEAALTLAAQAAGLEAEETRATIASGLRAGRAHPRDHNRGHPSQIDDLLLTELAELARIIRDAPTLAA
jgi:hypothetical protein